ncbi:MAG: DUF1194 domain-containing protein [Proteobacteria bacterium]|nr:DUF1194 domain-containing protein [Pseudomonadota bacterium]
MAFWAATIMAPAANAEPPVDLELVIAVDTSGSIDDIEASLQRQGYVHAFRHPAIMEAIKRGRHGAIAVTYMEWAGDHHQQILVPWKLINSAASALDFAAALAFEPLMISVWTSISGAIRGGMQAFADSPYRAERRVIDISGDGANNDGEIVTRARDRAVAKGYIINGLPIVNDRPSRYGRRQIPNLDFYYTDCVVGGPGAFIIVANGFDDYARAVHRKLILEIAGLAPENTPEPRPAIIPAAGEGRPPCTIGEILRQHWDDL